MSYRRIASRTGTTNSNIKKLIKTGEGSRGLAGRIITTSSNNTKFVGGRLPPVSQRLWAQPQVKHKFSGMPSGEKAR
jgi:hypothetical protein